MSAILSPQSTVDLRTTSKDVGAIFSYGITFGISFAILLFTAILFAAYLFTRANTPSPRPSALNPHRPADGGTDIESGLDEATLASYPTSRYSEHGKLTTTTSCAICLADYKESDELRQLPECGHDFHLKCVDPWLRLHASCPLCRTSPLPTPLAEVVPLAVQVV